MMLVHSQGQFISFVADKRKCIIYWGTCESHFAILR
jgi:hypothetical protein